MVTINERNLVNDTNRETGLLREKVERDMEGLLNEYGAPVADPGPEREPDLPLTNFAYGIPMAGVRYYSFVPER